MIGLLRCAITKFKSDRDITMTTVIETQMLIRRSVNIVFNAFIVAVKGKKQTPIDVYDSVTMSVITPLSTKSLKEGNKPQQFPDFTRGKWVDRKNTFALDDSGF